MNKKQYNNVINYTLKHKQVTKTDDSLSIARTIFNNMGVALPQGDIKTVYETIKTDNYMSWKSCTMREAQSAADRGIAAIGISEDRIVVISANDEEEPVAQTASVITLDENISAFAVDDLGYYTYGYGTTESVGCNLQDGLCFGNGNLSVDVGWRGYNQLYGNTFSTVYWSSSNTSVASVDYYSGYITAKQAGVATITARCVSNSCDCATFDIWVKGKTPVFLIHGRTSNSKGVWGINNNISDGKNNHFNWDINALSLNSKKYTDINSQTLGSFEPNKGDNDTDYPCNLGNELIDVGYKKNINLFAFNYPNEDAVKYSAQKFETYINNLISYVRTSGNNEMKACFYASKNDYYNNNYKINIVGHSMGGLVARYYIENLYYHYSVSKLVTICTPHWGSGYAHLSNTIGAMHALCDHDLDFDSAMYGGTNSTTVNCDKESCSQNEYIVTETLQYQRPRVTKYYAIAGIDYDAAYVNLNDYTFEMPTNFTTSQEITNYLVSKNVYKIGGKDLHIDYPPNPRNIGDNMVGFFSQIGWIGDHNDVNTPQPKIQMEKIFIDVDTDGGNSLDGGFVWELLYGFGSEIFHNKVPHRIPVCNKVIEYLEE